VIAPLIAAAVLGGLAPAPGVQVPRGFGAQVYATGLERPTAMAFGPDRLLYVTEERGAVAVVGAGSTAPRRIATGFRTPLGLAWIGRTLFVSSAGRLERMRVGTRGVWARRAIVRGLPFGRHQQDNVVVAEDGRLWFGSGSTCDVCRERDPRSAAVLSVRPDGSGLRIEATGTRNPYGLFPAKGGGVLVTVNGQDTLGDDEPAEMLVLARRGRFFGWPRCWPSYARRRLVGSCAGVTKPLAYLEPHSSANGLVHGALGTDDAFVALWGQYYAHDHGRYVARVDFDTGRVTRFVRGLPHPLAVARAPDGSLLVADWERGTIYRIRRL
jgi:glucose/arabinose dehydrogenase